MTATRLVERFGRHLALTETEQSALAALAPSRFAVRRGGRILGEGERAAGPFVVEEGWVRSSVLLGNGGRQITRIAMPGDLVSLSAVVYAEASESIAALTDATFSSVEPQRLSALFADHPRLAATLFTIAVEDGTALVDRLSSVGRTPARARVATLLCDLFIRMRAAHPETTSFQLPLTQEEIGDATGLTAVHVNRMMRGLLDDGIICRRGSTFQILSERQLFKEAGCLAARECATRWLPDAREAAAV